MKLSLLFLFSLLPAIYCITLEQLNFQKLDSNNLNVQVQGDSNSIPEDDTWIKKYFLVKSVGKNKKTTYQNLITKLKRISIHLRKKLIIPNENFLIGTHISSKYLAKKQCWSFSQIILIYAKQDDAEAVEATFKQSKIEGINTSADLEQFKQKFQVIRAFYDTKVKVSNKIKSNKSLEIDDVINMDILTPDIDKQINQLEYIQDLEDEQDSSDQQQSRSQQKERKKSNKEKNKIKNIHIKVIFKLQLDLQLDDDDDEKQAIFSNEMNTMFQDDL